MSAIRWRCSAIVMSRLPERVQVFPTENYYYFGFMHDGIRYTGNIRLDASNRDDGKADFAYFEDTALWFDDAEVTLPSSRRTGRQRREGRAAHLSGVVSRQERHLRAQRSAPREAAGGRALGDENFIGPIFDEFAIRFFLVFNRQAQDLPLPARRDREGRRSVLFAEEVDRILSASAPALRSTGTIGSTGKS